MQFVFTYIRKPVGPGELWGRAACACRGASAALRRAGHSGAGQSGPSAAPAQPQRAQRCQGGTDPLLSGLGKREKTCQGEKWRSRYVRRILAAAGWRSRGAGRVGSERGLRFQLLFPVERPGSSVRAAGQSGRCCGAAPATPLTFRVLLSGCTFVLLRDSQTFLALLEHSWEPRLEIELRCFGLLAEELQIHNITILVYLGKEVLDVFVIWYFF